MDGMVINCKSQ